MPRSRRPIATAAIPLAVVGAVILGALFLRLVWPGIAAPRPASPILASTLFSAVLALLTAAPLAALYRRGAWRAFWVGFALFGWIYLGLSLGPWFETQVGPHLLTSLALDRIEHSDSHESSRTGRASRTVEPPDDARRAGHAAFGLLAAVAGGALARFLHETRVDRRAEAADKALKVMLRVLEASLL